MEPAKQYNAWEKANVLLSVLTPIAVVVMGSIISSQANTRADEARLAQEKIAADYRASQDAIAQKNADRQDERERWALVPGFMDALTSSDQTKRDLAVRTIRAVLPDKADIILAGIPVSGLSPSAQAVVSDALKQLAADLLNPEKPRRQAAYDALFSSSSDKREIARAIAEAVKDAQNRDLEDQGRVQGLWNAMKLLSFMDGKVLADEQVNIKPALDIARSNGTQTETFVNTITSKIQNAKTVAPAQ